MDKAVKFDFITDLEDCVVDGTFAILQSYFSDIRPVDKYIRATIGTIFSATCKEIYKDKMPRKVSKKKVIKIQQSVIRKLRIRYGKWLNFNLVWSQRTGFKFYTNLNSTYITAKGKLYGHRENSSLRPLFYTSHVLERFDDRVDPSRYDYFYKTYRRIYGVYPTAVDLLDQLIMFAHQFGIEGDDRYLNVGFGVLVITIFKGIYIVKTFLTPDMILENNVRWVELAPTTFEEKELDGGIYMGDFNGFFEHKSVECEPEFLCDDECLPTEASIVLARGLKKL